MNSKIGLVLISKDPPLQTAPATITDSESDDGHSMERRFSASSSLDSRDSLSSGCFSNFQDDGDDEMSLSEWSKWVDQYGQGLWPSDKPLAVPPRLLNVTNAPTSSNHSSTSNLSSISKISSASKRSTGSFELYETPGTSLPAIRITADDRTPQGIAQHFRENGFLGAPAPGPHEDERLATMQKYGLLQSVRREAVDRICRIVKAYFKTNTVVLSLILEEHSILASEVGWGPEEPPADTAPREVSLNDSFCSHAVTKPTGSDCFVVPNASEDWRFKNNPSVRDNGPLQFYASANINLPAQGNEGTPSTLPVGSICVIDNRPRQAENFGAADRAILKDMADLIARELQLGYERTRRELEAKQTAFVGEFLATTSNHSRSPTVSPTGSPRPAARQSITELCDRPFEAAARALRELTSASTAAIIDLRSFRRMLQTSTTHDSGFATRTMDASAIYLLGSDRSTAADFDWSNCIEKSEDEIAHCLRESLLDQDRSSTRIDGASAFSQILPQETGAVCLVPIFDRDSVDNTPSLILILTSTEAHRRFEAGDLQFTENVGHIVLAALLRAKAFEADRSKLLFLSTVSHELRTPLHGVISQVELIREFSSELPKISPWLECAEVCLEALRDVLNDTLDFSKLANKSQKEIKDARGRNLQRVDLEKLLEDVVLATWVRKRRVDLVSTDNAPVAPKVDVILAIGQRATGWIANADMGGLKRTLLNIVGNAIKFTKQGSVRISLSEVPSPLNDSNLRTIQFLVEDTGCGMSSEFLRSGSAFIPFKQEDPFASGTGLGLSICEQIIHRMGPGTGGKIDVSSVLNQGTSVRITVALELLVSSPSSTSAASQFANRSRARRPSTTAADGENLFHTRVISEELSNLFDPSFAALRAATPPYEHQGFNFTEALEKIKLNSSLDPVATAVKSPLLRKDSSESSDSFATTVSNECQSPVTSIGSSDYLGSKIGDKSLAPDIRVILADDNPIARKCLAKLLSGKGIEFVQCVDGQEAIDAYRQYGSFDIALLDLQMPRVDGIEAAYLIREHERMLSLPPCRIVALTGLSSATDMARGVGLVDVWLIKGGKSMRAVLDEIVTLQLVHDAKRNPHSTAISVA